MISLSKIFLTDKKFEIIDSSFCTGKFNMDFDLQRAREVEDNSARPMFRIYGWKPWCLSLGHNQNDENIDKESLSKSGFDIIKRPTGGRAVFHSDELTYSLVMKLNDKINKRDAYRIFHEILNKAFMGLGIETDFIKSDSDQRSFRKMEGHKESCFGSSARYELEKDGKKIVGSAQRIIGDTLLQHGSVLLSDSHLRIIDFIKSEQKETLLGFLKSKSTSLSEIAGKEINYSQLGNSILNIIEQ
jgi:lipoyl(octanoyl) transferase